MDTLPRAPALPTDNLYKFVCIVGLVGLVVSMAGMYLLQRDHGRLEGELARVKAMQRDLDLTLDAFEKGVGKTAEDDARPRTEAAPAADATTPPTFAPLQALMMDQNRRLDQRLQAEYSLTASIEDMKARLDREPPLLDRLSWGSFVVCLLGFLAWYFRHQVHQDTIVRAQAKKAVADAETAEHEAHPPPKNPLIVP
jgi:hypothetical protein